VVMAAVVRVGLEMSCVLVAMGHGGQFELELEDKTIEPPGSSTGLGVCASQNSTLSV